MPVRLKRPGTGIWRTATDPSSTLTPDRPVYYIYAPRYVGTSAGIRGLYSLARSLREAGQEAWIVTYAGHTQDQLPESESDLVLDYDTSLAYAADAIAPIAVYSEVVDGNPLKASAVVRYVMNAPGLLGGSETYDANECVYAFSEVLAQAIGKPDWSLFMPLVDEDQFPAGTGPRTITCTYASKYRAVHGREPRGVPQDTIEISRDLQNSPDPKELVALLQRADTTYVFENTALAIEAVLCGSIVVFMPNEFLLYSIGAKDHGSDGMAWGDSPEELARARATLPHFRTAYAACRAAYPQRLQLFVARTTAYRAGVEGRGIDLSFLKPPTYAQLASEATARQLRSRGIGYVGLKAVQVLMREGPVATMAIVADLLKKRFSA